MPPATQPDPWDNLPDDLKPEMMLEMLVDSQSTALYATGRIWDDGIIHPRDTRTVLGMAISAAHSNTVQGAREYGIWRH